MRKFLLPVIVAVFLFSHNTEAKHIFGADLSYKNLSGLNYEVTLTLYGDCSGAPSFSNLFSAIPTLRIYNGLNAYANYQMQPFGAPGVEVTPVCAAQISNTSCNGGTLPGISRFVYKSMVTLPSTSSSWRFIFDGDLGNSGGSAGRSTLITNIIQSGFGSSVMRLEATLNNDPAAGGANHNSADYTTIPTPFFCINFPQQYNQGAIDADGDVLSYAMIEGLEQGGSAVPYLAPYTFTEPLPVQVGSFQFNGNSGQMNFTPNMVSNNLVVTQVTEKRNGVIIGTTMREMVFVIQNNCSNSSPSGTITSPSVGLLNGAGTEIRLCEGQTNSLQFTIPVSDPDTGNVSVTLNGLSANLTATVVNNNTPNPQIQVTFTVPNPFVAGSYTLFATYQDDDCPMSSKQTQAYTILLYNPFTLSAVSTQESCNPGGDATIQINGSSLNPGSMQFALNSSPYQNSNVFSNLTMGSFTVTVIDGAGCKIALPVVISPTIKPVIDSVLVNDISCHNNNDGNTQLYISSSTGYSATLLPSSQMNNTGYFDNLSEGIYTVNVLDGNGCIVSTTFSIVNPPPLGFISVDLFPSTCDKDNGKIVAQSNISNTTFFLKPGIGASSEGVFQDLAANIYTLSVRSGNNCSHDTVVTLGDIPNNFSAYVTHQDLPCIGAGYEGQAEVFPSGGTGPYTYLWTSRDMPPSSDKAISKLYYGWYFVTTTDALGCETKDTVYVKPGNCCEQIFAPDVFTPNGDGVNDTWHVISSTGIQVEQFRIFNRWGQKVFDEEDQRATWDGRQKGRTVDNGTYFYMLRYTCLNDGKIYIKKGEINVIN